MNVEPSEWVTREWVEEVVRGDHIGNYVAKSEALLWCYAKLIEAERTIEAMVDAERRSGE